MRPVTAASFSPLCIAPTHVYRGWSILSQAGEAIAQWGHHPLLVVSPQRYQQLEQEWQAIARSHDLTFSVGTFHGECSESTLAQLRQEAQGSDLIIGIGGGKALDTAKLLGHQLHLPVVTIPTSAATCAAWTALSNIYTEAGAFAYDVALHRCPDLLLLDYALIQTAPKRTLLAGIGDALAKWYEASVSSGHRQETLIVAAVQQARVLRDILLQQSAEALANVGSTAWENVVDASVLMAGMIGGLGGAQCRTVAAHAVHNGLTQLPQSRGTLHGEKVAYGILVQLRLEELVQGSQLAASARHQLCQFYEQVGLPLSLEDLGFQEASLAQLQHAATVACAPHSDIHYLPFAVTPDLLLEAMVSTVVGYSATVLDGSAR
ncbi:iron-containing alcohol dehydrogenase family protein [Thermosynechococcus sp. TG252]|uniref:iron-containing alcohol dehydrogenase family protein n=1 Tax=Thermosynechococcus sp. TG252 TaxID=3074097 RepID=UPI0037DCB5BA